MDSFKYDIAISLCNQDVEFARKLKAALNPRLKIFFYEDNQQELITKSGPEAFGKVFKEESRIVVILSRDEWSESFYTEIEKNAIIDRTSVRNQAYRFLFVIPMMPQQIPAWYPSTRIYADPRRFTIEDIAKFIEFKVTEEGGIIVPVTAEDLSANFIDRLNNKMKTVTTQSTSAAIDSLETALSDLRNMFNSKVEHFSQQTPFPLSKRIFSDSTLSSFFGINQYKLWCKIHMVLGQHLANTQQIKMELNISREIERDVYGPDIQICSSQTYRFLYTEDIVGWSIPIPVPKQKNYNNIYFFSPNHWSELYDLKKPLPSDALLDKWFLMLWEIVIKEYASGL